MYRQCMTAIVQLMLPPFVPDVTIHVDSLEIYDVTSLCVSSYQAHSQGGGGSPHPLLIMELALGPKVSRFSYLTR